MATISPLEFPVTPSKMTILLIGNIESMLTFNPQVNPFVCIRQLFIEQSLNIFGTEYKPDKAELRGVRNLMRKSRCKERILTELEKC